MIYIIGKCLLVLFVLSTFMFLFMDLTESKYLIEEMDLDILEKKIILEEKEHQLEQLDKEVKSVLSEDIERRRTGEIQENSVH